MKSIVIRMMMMMILRVCIMQIFFFSRITCVCTREFLCFGRKLYGKNRCEAGVFWDMAGALECVSVVYPSLLR